MVREWIFHTVTVTSTVQYPQEPRNDPPRYRVNNRDEPSLPALRTLRPILFLLLTVGVLSACRKDVKFTDESGISLDFSKDTVLFDTIFTTVNSVTKRFVARNPSSNAVRVDISLEGGTPSPFRINVDGASGISFSDVEILGGDSVFIFVEANLDQSNTSNPFIFEDHIQFNTNGTVQEVLLLAWGQDAHFIYPTPEIAIEGLPPYSYIAGGYDENGMQICETVTWTNDLPYVIYGYGVVDSCCTLIIEAGVQVYVHGGGGLWVLHSGQIKAIADVGQEIVFQGDRLEPFYSELPGQWDRIWINEGPAENSNEFSNVLIKNALIGIQCEVFPPYSGSPTSDTKLILNNVKIRNCSAAGILSRNYNIVANNLLVGDCGQYGVALTGGGKYAFDHFTIANYWDYDIRQTPAFYLNNVFQSFDGGLEVHDIPNSSFINGIVSGTNANEFQLEFNDLQLPTGLNFRYMMLRTDQSTNNPSYFPLQTSIHRNQNAAFVDVPGRNFHIGGGSYARGRAFPGTANANTVFDLDNVLRGSDNAWDLGCYEYVP